MTINIRVKKLKQNAKLPTRGSVQAAGYDLYACLEGEALTIKPHETVKIGTGLCIEIPEGFFGGIFARSGLATKKGLRPANCVGVADSDYRGEYIISLYNDSDLPQRIEQHERIAQLIVLPFLPVNFVEVEELSETERGAGGFGSTGR
jgi:dUTP pyrophosphatase